MSNTDDIDKFGHCVICHKNLLTKRVVDGKVVDMLLPIYDHTFFLLNTGSQMQVTICKPCKEITDLNISENHERIMEACQKGWELETKLLLDSKIDPEYTEEKRQEYLNERKKLEIDCHSEELDKNILENKSKELSMSFRDGGE